MVNFREKGAYVCHTSQRQKDTLQQRAVDYVFSTTICGNENRVDEKTKKPHLFNIIAYVCSLVLLLL